MKKIHYKDYRIGKYVFTVKFIFALNGGGGIRNGSAIIVHVMNWHQPPRNLWGRISEIWKYSLDCSTWDPMLTNMTLEDYTIYRCNHEAEWQMNVERCNKEWETF